MAKSLMIDEFHLTVFAPRDLPDEEYDAIRLVLDNEDFQTALREAVIEVLRVFPALAKVGVRLSR